MDNETDDLTAFAGTVFELTDLVDYQDGAIVSRTLLDRSGTTVTAFALAAGQRISEHTAPHDALVQVIAGTARLELDGESHTVDEGESFVFPAEKPHAVAAHSPFKMVLTMVR